MRSCRNLSIAVPAVLSAGCSRKFPFVQSRESVARSRAGGEEGSCRATQGPDARNILAYLLAETGNSLDEAVKLARAAVSAAPNNPVFLDTLDFVACAYHTGMAWFQKRETAKALLAHALVLAPSKEIEAGANSLLSRIN